MLKLNRCFSKTPFLIVSCFGVIFTLIVQVQHDKAELGDKSMVKRLHSNNISTPMVKDKEKLAMNQDDPRLIRKIKEEYLFPPSPESYNLTNADEDPSLWQAQFVKELLHQKKISTTLDVDLNFNLGKTPKPKNGFYVDAGANEGEWISNTLAFEKQDGWEGILVEAVPENFQLLQSKHRKAFTVPACLSDTKYPKTMEFQMLGPRSRLTSMGKETNQVVAVQCFPLYSILLAAGRTKIDYFSLDVEGSELDVLKTIPWDKVEITAISVEYENIMRKKKELRNFMEEKGYYWVAHPPETVMAYDYIFYRADLLPRQMETGKHLEKRNLN